MSHEEAGSNQVRPRKRLNVTTVSKRSKHCPCLSRIFRVLILNVVDDEEMKRNVFRLRRGEVESRVSVRTPPQN